jgi:hypothetical protein
MGAVGARIDIDRDEGGFEDVVGRCGCQWGVTP